MLSYLKRCFCSLFLILTLTLANANPISVTGLRCDYRVNPIGVDNPQPFLSWEIKSDARNVWQQAYRILVASDSNLLKKGVGNIWDTRVVQSRASINVAYTGKKLKANQTYYWRVQVNTQRGVAGQWSNIAHWHTGLITKADWGGAQWIGYDKLADSNVNILPIDGNPDKYNGNNILPYLRKSFEVSKPIASAHLFISGLGHFEASLNGQKIGDHFLDPGWVKYDKEALYVGFDITNHLKQGENVLGVMLGNGFHFVPPVKGRFRKLKVAFGHPKLISKLVIKYKDGSEKTILSDQSWKAAPGPIVFSSIYGGEDYDANLEQAGWNDAGFNDQNWQSVIEVGGPPKLMAQMAEPLKVMQTFMPIHSTTLESGDQIFDMGQNASGIVELQVQGRKGDTVRVAPGELLKDGKVTQQATGGPFYFTYILKGNEIETWQPRFTYYGFRYLQVSISGSQNATKLLSIKSLHTSNAAERVGEFACSNELFNKTNTLIDWAIKSNMASVFTDCPHREKLGWLEESHLVGPSVRYQYQIANMGRKVVGDMMASQLSDGLVPETAPEYVHFTWGGTIFRDSPEWGSASIILPWYLYQWYGDTTLMVKAYPMMKKYIGYLQTKAENHILSQGLGDWYDLGPERPGVSQLTPMGVTGTAIYYYDLVILEKIAKKLGKPAEAESFRLLGIEVKNAFNKKFFDAEKVNYATGSQTANAMAIYMNLVPDQHRAKLLENLVDSIRKNQNRLTAGDIGYRYLLRVLESEGRSDVIFDMNSRSDVPGYGYQLAKGATALTESWEALPSVSNNHFMLGHIMEWFYSGLCGIQNQSAAFSAIIIKPEPVGDVTWAEASHKTLYGMLKSRWEIKNGQFLQFLTIPPNTTATLYLPAKKGSRITESGGKVADLTYANGRAIIKLGSGNYSFLVE